MGGGWVVVCMDVSVGVWWSVVGWWLFGCMDGYVGRWLVALWMDVSVGGWFFSRMYGWICR